jgi:hypothetical protein
MWFDLLYASAQLRRRDLQPAASGAAVGAGTLHLHESVRPRQSERRGGPRRVARSPIGYARTFSCVPGALSVTGYGRTFYAATRWLVPGVRVLRVGYDALLYIRRCGMCCSCGGTAAI